jgi:hypothetical protein
MLDDAATAPERRFFDSEPARQFEHGAAHAFHFACVFRFNRDKSFGNNNAEQQRRSA